MTLQEQVDALRRRQAPIPLTPIQQVMQAAMLRDTGMDYTAISQAMGVYHGAWYSPAGWNYRLRRNGLHEPKHYANGSHRVPPQLKEA